MYDVTLYLSSSGDSFNLMIDGESGFKNINIQSANIHPYTKHTKRYFVFFKVSKISKETKTLI